MAKAFKGRWRISGMDVWDNDYLDLVEKRWHRSGPESGICAGVRPALGTSGAISAHCPIRHHRRLVRREEGVPALLESVGLGRARNPNATRADAVRLIKFRILHLIALEVVVEISHAQSRGWRPSRELQGA